VSFCARAEATGATEVLATEPGEFRLIAALEECPIPVHQFPDDRFLCSHAEFEAWAEGRKELRMEWFYREMRRKTGLLMDGRQARGRQVELRPRQPQARPGRGDFGGPMQFTPDETVEEVLDLVEARFGDNFGTLRPFWFATDRGQARRALAHFIEGALPKFGDYQDAMLDGDRFLYHAVISMYLNAGLLGWREVCEAAVEAYRPAMRRSTRWRGSSARSSAGANTCAASISARDRTT
jgi:deoxyribodipyrimidine photolyase-related protein